MEEKGCNSFSSDGFLSWAENYPLSKPMEMGRSVIKSQEICWKGRDAEDFIRKSGGMVGWMLVLFC